MQLRMVRNVEQAKLERECNEKAQRIAALDEKASLQASTEDRKYDDWLKKLDSQCKVFDLPVVV